MSSSSCAPVSSLPSNVGARSCVYGNNLQINNNDLYKAIESCCLSVNDNAIATTTDGCFTSCENTSVNNRFAFISCIADKQIDGTGDTANFPTCKDDGLATESNTDGGQPIATKTNSANGSSSIGPESSATSSASVSVTATSTVSEALVPISSPTSSNPPASSPTNAASSVVISKAALGVMTLLLFTFLGA